MDICDICGRPSNVLYRVSDGTESGEMDIMCEDCRDGRYPAPGACDWRDGAYLAPDDSEIGD